MPELDHLIFAAPDLDQGVSHIERLTGATAVVGGPHPGVGTHNALLGLDATTYFEVIAIDPSQPKPDQPRPFGLDENVAPRLAGYAVHPTGDETIEGLASTMRSLGFDPGPVAAMSRVKPDGEELRWRLTRLRGPSSLQAGGALPFVIDWGKTASPAASLPSMGSLASLRVHHPDPSIRSTVGTLNLGVETVESKIALVAIVDTGRGQVAIL